MNRKWCFFVAEPGEENPYRAPRLLVADSPR